MSTKLYDQLVNINGIGPKLAKELLSAGIEKISDLRLKKFNGMLSEEAKLFVKLKPLKKIPHTFAKKVESKIHKIASDSNFDIMVTGSYRRKLEYSGDIDVVIVDTNIDIMDNFLSAFKNKYVYACGKDKISLILKIYGKYIKMDIFRTPSEEKWATILYSTGSKNFNIRMRLKAKKMGLLLNQKGIFKGGKNLTKNAKSEKIFFEILGMKYVPPEKRL